VTSRFAAFRVLLLLACSAAGAAPAGAEPPDWATRLNVLEREIERRMEADRIPSLSIAVVRGEEVVWTAAYGYSNVWAQTKATPQTLYSTGSTFKTVTATAVMRLVEKGLAELDDPVAPLLGDDAPSQPAGAKPITLRHLLTHVSGLPASGANVPLWDRALPPTLEAATSRLAAAVPPEQQTVYSNVAFALAGRLAGALGKKPFDVLVREEVLDPVGMTRTTLSPSGPDAERMAIPYARTAGRVEPIRQVRFDVWPAGDAYTTAENLARFLAMHVSGGVVGGKRVLSEASCAEMHRRQFFRERGASGFGLAFVVDETPGRRTISHDGLVPGFTAHFVGDLDRKVGVVALCNLTEGSRALAGIARVAIKALRGEEWTAFDPATVARDPVPAAWTALEGTYVGGAAGPVRVTVVRNALRIESAGGSGWLVEGEGGRYDVRGDDVPEGIWIRFASDAEGRVTGYESSTGTKTTKAGGTAATDMDLTLPPEGDPVGAWEGEVSLGSMRVEFALRVRREPGGALAAAIDVPFQGMRDVAMDHVLHHGKRVHFEYGEGAGKAVVDGMLDGDVVKGTMQRGPLRLPITGYRAGSEAAAQAKAARAAKTPPPGK
jgi:serine-type D-Ala-D-Ala carboxypeptidase/endopeptidase